VLKSFWSRNIIIRCWIRSI